MTFFESPSRSSLLLEHDPSGRARGHAFLKTGIHPGSSPGHAFRDHALVGRLLNDAYVSNNDAPTVGETNPSLRHAPYFTPGAVTRWKRVDAIAKSRPNVVITVFDRVPARPADGRAALKGFDFLIAVQIL